MGNVSTVASATDLSSRVVVLARNMEFISRTDLSCHAIALAPDFLIK